MAIPGLFFFIFVFSKQLIVNKICRWLDLNHRSLVSEVNALPTEPQPLPNFMIFYMSVFVCVIKKSFQLNKSDLLLSVVMSQ